jgi:hypothetical protein
VNQDCQIPEILVQIEAFPAAVSPPAGGLVCWARSLAVLVDVDHLDLARLDRLHEERPVLHQLPARPDRAVLVVVDVGRERRLGVSAVVEVELPEV